MLVLFNHGFLLTAVVSEPFPDGSQFRFERLHVLLTLAPTANPLLEIFLYLADCKLLLGSLLTKQTHLLFVHVAEVLTLINEFGLKTEGLTPLLLDHAVGVHELSLQSGWRDRLVILRYCGQSSVHLI